MFARTQLRASSIRSCRSFATESAAATASTSAPSATRLPFTRAFRVSGLPAGYDVNNVLNKLNFPHLQRVDAHPDSVFIHSYSPSTVTNFYAKQKEVNIDGKTYPVQLASQKPLSALEVARLGYKNTGRAVAAFGFSSEASLKAKAESFGPVQKIIPIPKGGYVVICHNSNDAQKIIASPSPLEPNARVVLSRYSISQTLPTEPEADVLAELTNVADWSQHKVDYFVRAATQGILPEERIWKIYREDSKWVIQFVSSTCAQAFGRYMKTQEPTLKLQFKTAPLLPMNQRVAVAAGANRKLILNMGNSQYRLGDITKDFRTFGFATASHKRNESTVVELTFAGTYSAMAALYRLASGNHQLAKYAGKSINFAHMAGHWGTQAVMIAHPKAEAKADPKSI